MRKVYMVKGIIEYEATQTLAVFGKEDAAHVFMEEYAATAAAHREAGDYDSDYWVYDFYEVEEIEVQ